MLVVLFGMTFLAAAAGTDTTISFGVVKRDLTGDGIPETLTLVGAGTTLRSLRVTFTIESSGQTVFVNNWPCTRPLDGGRRISDAQLRTQITEYGRWFFDDSKFMSPTAFVTMLQKSARLHIDLIPRVIAKEADTSRAPAIWEQMRSSPITIFEFSTGGDGVTAIGWSSNDKRFYHLFECC
jgi:hypothetical protein